MSFRPKYLVIKACGFSLTFNFIYLVLYHLCIKYRIPSNMIIKTLIFEFCMKNLKKKKKKSKHT